jgi:hypothetical protein
MKRWIVAMAMVLLTGLPVMQTASANVDGKVGAPKVTQSIHAFFSPSVSAPICQVTSTVDKDIWRGVARSGCAYKYATAYSYIGGQIGTDNFGPGYPGYINPPSYVDIYRVRLIVQNKYGAYRIFDHYADGRTIKISGIAETADTHARMGDSVPVVAAVVPTGLVPCPTWLCGSDGRTDCGIYIYQPTYYRSTGNWRPISSDFVASVCRNVLNGKAASIYLYKVPPIDYGYSNATVTLFRTKTGGYAYTATNDSGNADLKDSARWNRTHLIPLAKF